MTLNRKLLLLPSRLFKVLACLNIKLRFITQKRLESRMSLMVMIYFLSSLADLILYTEVYSFKPLESSLLTADLLVLSFSQLRSIVHLVLDNSFIVLNLRLNLLFLVQLKVQLLNRSVK